MMYLPNAHIKCVPTANAVYQLFKQTKKKTIVILNRYQIRYMCMCVCVQHICSSILFIYLPNNFNSRASFVLNSTAIVFARDYKKYNIHII